MHSRSVKLGRCLGSQDNLNFVKSCIYIYVGGQGRGGEIEEGRGDRRRNVSWGGEGDGRSGMWGGEWS